MKFFLLFLTISILLFCKKEDTIQDIDQLIEKEKFNSAQDKIKSILENKKSNDEILSYKKNLKPRILEVSNDRNRIVWLDDKQIQFRDLANPQVKSLSFPDLPEGMSISSNAEYVLLHFPLPSGSGCRMVNISLLEPKPSYFSETYVSCRNKTAVSYDGSSIYYFINDNLYEESIFEPKKPKLIISKERFDSVVPGMKNRTHIFPIAKTFLIFFGNAGLYYLYWFNPQNHSIEKLANDITAPRIYYSNGKSGFVLGGVIGNHHIKEIKYTSHGKPSIGVSHQVGYGELNPNPTSKIGEFISGKSGNIYKWGFGIPKKTLPIISDRFWVVARDFIVYENKNKELILSSTEFTDEDWKLLDLYDKTKKN